MTVDSFTSALNAVADDANFMARAYELTDAWSAEGLGVEAVEPTLRFMEENPSVDYGAPGPLVHFVERFHGQGYEELLVASLNRYPTTHTVSMLVRIINGGATAQWHAELIALLERVRWNSAASETTRGIAQSFLEREQAM